MLRKLSILAISMCIAIGAHAETNNVWIGFAGGIMENLCKKTFNFYDTKYNTKTEFFVKSGADGSVAARDFANSKLPNRIMCTGSYFTYTRAMYPDIYVPTDLIMAVSTIPVIVYVPNKNTASTFNDLINGFRALNRPINVGVATAQQKTIINYISTQYKLPVNIVAYKTTTQWYPSLVDGSLDMAFDLGAAIPIAESGTFRIAGYIGPEKFKRLSTYERFAPQDKGLNSLNTWTGIAVPLGTGPAEKRKVTERLLEIFKSEEYLKAQAAVYSYEPIMLYLTGPELDKFVTTQLETIKKYQ